MSEKATINSVKVISVDEEKLKFRVIVSLNGQLLADQDSKGRYNFQIPIPTAIGNSYMFNQAIMKIESFTANAPFGNVLPTWEETSQAIPAGASVKIGSVIARIDTGSSQVVQNFQTGIGGIKDQQLHISGFRQLIPLRLDYVGDSTGVLQPTVTGASWHSIPDGCEPILTGNPFGRDCVLVLEHPSTANGQVFIANNGVGARRPDDGLYQFQLSIEMVPNR